jgi:LysR family hydrogen peroxide-inducible transcriptional activator
VLSLCDRLGVPEVTDLRATSLTTLVHMASGGMGVTVLPSMAAAPGSPATAALRTVPFRGTPPARTIVLAFRPTTARRQELAAVTRILRERAPAGTVPVPAPGRGQGDVKRG